MLRRLPIRLRLTVVFVVAMTAVLAVIGLVLFFWTRHSIDTSIQQSLRARQGTAAALVATQGTGRWTLPPGEQFAQILTPGGAVLASRPDDASPLLSPHQAALAARHVRAFERHEVARYLAGPVRAHGEHVVVVAAASLADHERALEGLSAALLVGVPLALLLAAGVAYVVAGRALRPVEEMRIRAATITSADSDARLPVPEVDDELRRLSQTLNAMLQRIGESAEHERRFVASASHELRTPLAALRAELELAERHATTIDEYHGAVARSRGDVERLIRLADTLLALARAQEAAPRFVRVDVDALLADAVRLVSSTSRAKHRQITVIPAAGDVIGDPDALMRAVSNLVENALVHGNGAITVGASVPADAPAYLELWVEDEGALHSSVTGRRAFERFARGADASGRPGSGLGLALVSAIALQHGGSADLAEIQAGGVRASLRVRRHAPPPAAN